MNEQVVPPSNHKRKRYKQRSSLLVTQQGGRTRKHKYWRDLTIFIAPALFAIVVQAAIYALLATRGSSIGWNRIFLVISCLSLVPIFSTVILSAFRKHDAPVVASSLVVLILYSVVITLLSGFRVQMSYFAIAMCMPIGVVVMAYANIRFHRTITTNAALVPFDGAEEVLRQFEINVPVLAGPDEDITDLDLLLVDPHSHYTEQWSSLLSRCYLSGVEILPWTRYIEITQGRLYIPTFDVSHIAYTPSQLLYARVKRGLDLFLVLITLPITLSLAFLVAAYIYCCDGGPVIFVQLRYGFGGRRFRMYKFRTMYKGTVGGATDADDKRIIPGCNLLRKLRLDELPQLYNIIIGDMSLIGPRPVATYIAKQAENVEPKYALRCLVLPGITGWAQVTSGYAGTVNQELEKLSHDLYYIKHLSFDLDMLIIFKTIRTVLLGQGAR